MRRNKPHTIKTRITVITVSFSLVVAVFLSTLSFGFFRAYARRSVIQSTEYNLQLIAGLLGQQLIEFNMLTKWASTNSLIALWLGDASGNTMLSLEVYERLREEYWNNRSREYIRRFIVADRGMTRFLQTGNNTSDSWPVTPYNLRMLALEGIETPRVYATLANDPYALLSDAQVLPVVRPIRGVGSRECVGYVYLGVSADVILSHLRNYPMPRDSRLYLSLPGAMYRLDGMKFADVSRSVSLVSSRNADTLSDQTLVGEIELPDGGKSLVVTCPIGFDGVSLSQTLSSREPEGERLLYAGILALISVAMLGFGLFISLLLGRIITRPVLKLRKKIDAIAASDFSRDASIEWDHELGDIGRGINDMSGKIVSLMESLLADEKRKRDLEYRMLQSQINPHFLYNTLNSIKWMATIQNATGIAEMTTSLSRLMKNVIKGSRTTVPLCEEIALLDDYFLIQQYRYGGAIVFEKDIPEGLQWVSIPCFILQPLMENAIFHGIEPKGGAGKIALRAARSGTGDVEIVLEDDGVGMAEAQVATVLSGEAPSAAAGLFREIGLASVDARLKHSYGPAYGLSIESEEGRYTRARLLVPFLTINAPPAPASGVAP